MTLQQSDANASGSGYGSDWFNVASGLQVATHTTVEHLTPNHRYYFRYVAVGSGGSVVGDQDFKSTLRLAPGVPEAPVFSATTNTTVTVIVPALPPDADTLTLLMQDGNGNYVTVPNGTNLYPGNAKVVDGLSPDTTYSFRFRAEGQDSTLGAASSVTTAPGQPGTPTFSGAASNSITVQIPALPSGATALTLQLHNGYSGSLYTTLASGLTPGGNSYTVTGLTSDSSYTFRWVAIGAHGSTAGSDNAISTISGGTYLLPKPVFTAATAGSVDVTAPWLPPYYGSSHPGTWTLQKKLPDDTWSTVSTLTYSSNPTTTVSGLDPNTAYTFRFVDGTDVGSTQGDENSVTTAPAAPGAPQAFDSIAATSLRVQAPAKPAGAGSLTLQERVVNGYEYMSDVYVDVAQNLNEGDWTLVSGLTPNTSYTFRYVAVGANGATAGTASSQATLPPAPGAPEAPVFTNVAATTLTVIVPPRPANAATLTLQRKAQGALDTTYTDVATALGASDVTVSVTGLSAQTAYTFRFVAVGGGGSTNGTGADVTTTPLPPDAPGVPQFETITQNSVTVDVPDKPARADSLTLQRRQYEGDWVTVNAGLTGGGQVQVTGLAPQMDYSFRWIAVGAGGSTTGLSAGLTTAAGGPPAPDAPQFSSLTEDSVTIVAPVVPAGADSLTLQIYNAAQGSYQDVVTGLHQGDPWTVEGLDTSATYSFRFLAVAYGASTAGAASDLTMPVPLISWGPGEAIACSGISWPVTGNTIQAGATGRLSSFLATDWDERAVTLSGQTVVKEYSDPCSYTWAANGGSFQNGLNTGQSVLWTAPATPGTYTITLVVDDQNALNQPANNGGSRNDAARGYNDQPLHFTTTVTVTP